MLVVEMAKYLAAQALGIFDETGVTGDIFIATLPPSPDSCIALYPTGGYQSDSKLGYSDPTIQVLVRGDKDPRTAFNKAKSIYDTLHGFRNGVFFNGGLWVVSCLGMQSTPIHLGTDSNGRHEYSLNFKLEIK